MPAREAFALGRLMVVPSARNPCPISCSKPPRPEKPLIATNVGGIPEIFGPLADRLIPPDDRDALSARLRRR